MHLPPHRQPDGEPGASTDLALDADVASGLAHEAVDHGQAEARPLPGGPLVSPVTVSQAIESLRGVQPEFDLTGGLHGAAVRRSDGTMLGFAEDIGRHNAVDKIVGWLLDNDQLPAHGLGLMLSGRASFELVQKALALLKEGGLLVASSNLQKMPLESYLKELRKGSLAVGCRLQVIKVAGQAEDFPFLTTFPEGNYLKYVVSVVQKIL